MQKENRHIANRIYPTINFNGRPEAVWQNITKVRIEQFAYPKIYMFSGIPRPMRADLLVEGIVGQRIAGFDSGKRFLLKVTACKPLKEYPFNLNPEKASKVGYILDISDGAFRAPNGYYLLLHDPVRLILKTFQKYLPASIKKNSE